MQTLKTAAIVVLLMTVIYSAYVSLTAPPEPLSADVQDLVINDRDLFAIDTSLPASLGDMEINTGQVTHDDYRDQVQSAESIANVGSQDSLSLPDSVGQQTFASVDPASAMNASDGGISTRITDLAPTPSSPAATEPTPAYPRTASSFQLPDPNNVSSSFTPSPTGVDLPDSNVALTSGISAEAPPEASAVTSPGGPNLGLANAIRIADKQYAQGKRKEALATLSLFYDTPALSGEERSELLSRLDPLAREVIYSRRHLLEQPYRVGQQETLVDVATRFEVPWQLLANINQIADPATVLPGTELKVVRGPFRADVSLALKELTLFTNDLYAGRFPIGVGTDPSPQPGTFTVQDKQTKRTFYGATGAPVPPGSPNNPYGEVWIDLGGQLSIHGSPSTTSPSDKGCISLAADFADDLYGILSQGSSVTIRR